MSRKTPGFTLIELMITVAIVAILASIAFPSYQSQMRKTRRADAQGALMGLANAMERFFTEKNTYLGAASGGANTGAPAIFATQAPIDGATKYYDLSINAATATTYTIQAAPIAGSAQAGDSCGTLSLTSTGVRSPSTTGCW